MIEALLTALIEQAEQAEKETETPSIKIFDWVKAAKILKNFKGVMEAKAGLKEDWDFTSGTILRDGSPIRACSRPLQLISSFATPILRIARLNQDYKEFSCYTTYDKQIHKNIYVTWPSEALRIFKNKDYKYGCLRPANSECRGKSFTEPGLCPSCKNPLTNFGSGQSETWDEKGQPDIRSAAMEFMLKARLHPHAGDSQEKRDLRKKVELHLLTLGRHLHHKLESNLCPEHLQAILNSIRAALDTVNGMRIPRLMGVFETKGMKHTLSITSEQTEGKG